MRSDGRSRGWRPHDTVAAIHTLQSVERDANVLRVRLSNSAGGHWPPRLPRSTCSPSLSAGSSGLHQFHRRRRLRDSVKLDGGWSLLRVRSSNYSTMHDKISGAGYRAIERALVVVKTGAYTTADLRGLAEAVGKFRAFRPVVICDPGEEAAARADRFDAMAWPDYLRSGLGG